MDIARADARPSNEANNEVKKGAESGFIRFEVPFKASREATQTSDGNLFSARYHPEPRFALVARAIHENAEQMNQDQALDCCCKLRVNFF